MPRHFLDCRARANRAKGRKVSMDGGDSQSWDLRKLDGEDNNSGSREMGLRTREEGKY